MPISHLKVNKKNPRTITELGIDKLRASLIDFPQMMDARPIVVDENNVVLGGHQKLEILKELGYQRVEVARVTDWTEEEKDKFLIKDNISYGHWDWGVVREDATEQELYDWGVIHTEPEQEQEESEPEARKEYEPSYTVLIPVYNTHYEKCRESVDNMLESGKSPANFILSVLSE